MSSASSLFLLSFCFRNLLLEIFSELDQILRGIFTRCKAQGHQRGAWGAHRGQGRPPAAAKGPPAGGTRPCPVGTPSAPSDAYKLPHDLKTSCGHYFPETRPRRAVSENPSSGSNLKLIPALRRTGDRSRRALHHHASLRDDL